jgi:predicted metal-dependent hydrolase|uniref:M48 family peptidase n=1 Tax=Meiothermus ruber TaxID=277 RepID=A0A7C3DEJ9_MEIRU
MPETEKATLHYQNRTIRYTIRRSARRRTVGITIDPQGVRVAAPERMPLEQVVALVNTKARWIAEKYVEFKNRLGPRKRFVSGEEFLYLGRRVSLQVQTEPSTSGGRRRDGRGFLFQPELFDFDFSSRSRQKTAVALKGNVLLVQAGASSVHSKEVREMLENWYRSRAEEVITRRVQHYALQLGWPMPKVLIRNQKKRWGSCNARGELRFNWRLVMLPLRVLDYVVVHEMAHLEVLNHSPRFWALVEQIMPDYKARHQALHELGLGLYW